MELMSAHNVDGNTSANLTVAPASAAALAVEIHDIAGTIISGKSSPDQPEMAERAAISSPCVAFPTATAKVDPTKSENSFSNARTSGPHDGAFASNTRRTASRSSSE
jgi:hypothetical protein